MAALLHFFACVFLGTTTSILGAFLVIGVYFLAYIFFHPSRTGTRFMMKALLIVIVGGGITYAGIKTYHFVTEFPFMVEKAERIWKEGPRARRLENAFAHFSERPVLTLLIGEGMYSFSQNYARADAVVGYNPEVMPLTEVDPVDLYGSYGLPFTIATYAPYLLWLAFSVKIWRNTRGRHTLSEIFILTLGLTISIVAGHVIFQPTALTALAIVAATVLLNRERVRVRGGKYA